MIAVVNPNGYGSRGVDQWVLFNGSFAVMFFYAISGFLISYVLAHKYRDSTNGMLDFYQSRFVRIFSLYWPMLVIALWLYQDQRDWIDWFFGIFVIGADWAAAFRDYPGEHVPFQNALGPMWSVGAELTFYVLAPRLLRSWRLSVAAFAVSMVTRLWLQSIWGYHTTWIYRFFPSVLCFFLAGHLARLLGDWQPLRARFLAFPALAVSIASVAMIVYTGIGHGMLNPWFYVAIFSFSLALPGLFQLTRDNTVLNWVGDLSYPVYVIHNILIATIWLPIAHGLRPAYLHVTESTLTTDSFAPVALVIAFVCSVLVAAVLAHYLIERPVGAAMRIAFVTLRTHRLSLFPAGKGPSAVPGSIPASTSAAETR